MSEEEIDQDSNDLPEDADLEKEPELDEAEELAQKEALRVKLLEAHEKAKREKALQSEDCPPCNKGSPAWMATFADMATLLMAFFVLILSFAHVNVPKYKEVSGSMRSRFGVQVTVPIVEAPTADNVVMQQYRQSRTQPTAADVVEEQRSREEQDPDVELDRDNGPGESDTNARAEEVEEILRKEIAEGIVTVAVEDGVVIIEALDNQSSDDETGKISQDTLALLSKVSDIQAELDGLVRVEGAQFAVHGQSNLNDINSIDGTSSRSQDQLEQIRANLSEEIDQGLAEVFRDGDLIVIRLAERGSFQSGSASLQTDFTSLLDNVGASLTGASGLVQIEGHTDNVPMSFGSRYRDNWDLSSARAASVADYLMDTGYVSAGSMVVKGLADTKAIASNDTALGRSANRRIEVVVLPN
ncbi:OmpA family protein [Gammaproteobacteria bacterium]|nr:OmpA family protein [Gammaproteobacteria bacterium]MDB2443607.1 OmpA family protein [Gammaproteobacteria bacterium]